MSPMRMQEDTITVSTRPPRAMDACDGTAYTKRVQWAMDIWEDVAKPQSEKWNAWIDAQNAKNEQRILSQGDLKSSRGHHYVPKFWMKRFADGKMVYQFNWGPPRRGFGKLRSLKGCMVEEDLSNIVDARGKVHATVELARSQIESDIADCWDEFTAQGTLYVNNNLAFKMEMSEYLSRLWYFSPWSSASVKQTAKQVVSASDYQLPSWKPDQLALDYLGDQVPLLKFYLFARNWTVLTTPSPLALPSQPMICSDNAPLLHASMICVPLCRRRILALAWGKTPDVTARALYRALWEHTYHMPSGYRTMVLHPDDKKDWVRSYNLHRGVVVGI